MTSLTRTIALLVTIALAGCAGTQPLTRAQVDKLSRDAGPGQLEQILGESKPTAQFEFAHDGRRFHAQHFLLVTGHQQSMVVVCVPTCISVPVTNPVLVDFVMVQNLPARSLHAWGTIEELSKSDDRSVSSIMPALKVALDAARKAR